ncbi:unnamed protein product [Lactuca saligna]|uniref:Uncharacterized protein n=1 Tax=Lactuca saligna TaxID=75948 RepID=A0AA35YMB9_LACSI|nr:unnamed protein product [Lactuca saligna]
MASCHGGSLRLPLDRTHSHTQSHNKPRTRPPCHGGMRWTKGVSGVEKFPDGSSDAVIGREMRRGGGGSNPPSTTAATAAERHLLESLSAISSQQQWQQASSASMEGGGGEDGRAIHEQPATTTHVASLSRY